MATTSLGFRTGYLPIFRRPLPSVCRRTLYPNPGRHPQATSRQLPACYVVAHQASRLDCERQKSPEYNRHKGQCQDTFLQCKYKTSCSCTLKLSDIKSKSNIDGGT